MDLKKVGVSLLFFAMSCLLGFSVQSLSTTDKVSFTLEGSVLPTGSIQILAPSGSQNFNVIRIPGSLSVDNRNLELQMEATSSVNSILQLKTINGGVLYPKFVGAVTSIRYQIETRHSGIVALEQGNFADVASINAGEVLSDSMKFTLNPQDIERAAVGVYQDEIILQLVER